MLIEKDKQHQQKKKEYRTINGITGKVTKFDQKLYDKYDIGARNVIKHVLKDGVKDNEDQYGEDMIFTTKGFPYKYLELQVCAYWEGDKYPYELPFIYARKMRFSKRTLFLTFNRYFTECIIFSRKYVSDTVSRLKKYDREHVHFIQWGKTMRMKTTQLTLNAIRRYSGEYIDSEEKLEELSESELNETINDTLKAINFESKEIKQTVLSATDVKHNDDDNL